MKTIVIYKSKTGFTKKYAEWIANDLLADIFDVSKVNIDMLTTYDTIIYGGSLYAVGINGIKLIKQNFDKILMTLLKWKIKSKKKEELTPDEIGMLSVYDKSVDFTREENIVEIINYVNS